MTAGGGPWIGRVAWAGAIAGLIYLAWSVWDHDAVTQWLGNARPLPFFTAMALLPMFGLPMTPFFIIAGASFGARTGAVGSLLALSANLVGCYALAQWIRPLLTRVLRRAGHAPPDFRGGARGAVRFTMAVKLAPGVPAFVKSYGLAMAGVPFPIYFALSILITGGYGIAVIMLGDSLFDHDARQLLLAGGLLVLLALGIWWIRRRGSRPSERAAAGSAR
jgi:uncharacterized membrane protein YdjX (TVP38/TMEM64 family)